WTLLTCLFSVRNTLGVDHLTKRAKLTVSFSLRIGKIISQISTSNALQDLFRIIFLLSYAQRTRIGALAHFDFN
ncbi:hypothetical protein MKW92_048678, partial [Papaver armeniacum]